MTSTLHKKAVSHLVTAALLLSLSATAIAADTAPGPSKAEIAQNKKDIRQDKKALVEDKKRLLPIRQSFEKTHWSTTKKSETRNRPSKRSYFRAMTTDII